MLRKMVTRMQDANMRTNKDTSDVLLALAANKSVGCATGAFAIPLSVCMHVCRCFIQTPRSCSSVAQALEVSKRLEAGAFAFADHHPVVARQRHDSRERFYGRLRHDILCRFVRFGQWPGCIIYAPRCLHMTIDMTWQVRLLAAQLVALVEKVGDKDKVST